MITDRDSGIGRAAAIAYAREGADVAIHYFSGEDRDAKEVADYVEKTGRKASLLLYDLREEQALKEMVTKTGAAFGGLDTLVLNAAQQISQESIEELPVKQVEDSFKVNIVSMFAIVQEALPHLSAGSSIVTTSVQAFNPSDHLMDYASTKAAIANFTVSLASQLAKKGIRVNGVAPGSIWAPLQLDQGQPKDALPKFGQDSLLERADQPAELAPVYVFLASNDANYVTSQIYGVTGGEPINLYGQGKSVCRFIRHTLLIVYYAINT